MKILNVLAFSACAYLVGLELRRSGARHAPYVEHALWQRATRVLKAFAEDRDPEQAFDIPLYNEQPLTPDAQLSREYREAQEEIERFLQIILRDKR